MKTISAAANGRPQLRGGNDVNRNEAEHSVSTSDVIYRAVEAFLLALDANVRVIRSIWPSLWRVGMEPCEIQKVLALLLEVARDAMPEGGVLRVHRVSPHRTAGR